MIASKSVEVKSSVTTIGGKSSVSFPWQFAFDWLNNDVKERQKIVKIKERHIFEDEEQLLYKSHYQLTEAQLDPRHTWTPEPFCSIGSLAKIGYFLKRKQTFWTNPAMSPTLTEKQNYAPGTYWLIFLFFRQISKLCRINSKRPFPFLKNPILRGIQLCLSPMSTKYMLFFLL